LTHYLLLLLLLYFVLLVDLQYLFLLHESLLILHQIQHKFNVGILTVASFAIAWFHVIRLHYVLTLAVFTVPFVILGSILICLCGTLLVINAFWNLFAILFILRISFIKSFLFLLPFFYLFLI
jgi:hypothetical protein